MNRSTAILTPGLVLQSLPLLAQRGRAQFNSFSGFQPSPHVALPEKK
jgi:hypothetical protein